MAIRIDVISDVVCPWCAIGLSSLEQALAMVKDEGIEAEIHLHPFELSPEMGSAGENVITYLCNKYGMTADQVRENWQTITSRGKDVGFDFNFTADSQKWNTFNAHRLLSWAATQGRQLDLKMALLEGYFTHNRNVDDTDVLVQIAASVGLNADDARAVLTSEQFALEVREDEQQWQEMGVRSVPTMVFNQRYAVSGGQPPGSLVQVLRKVASDPS